MRSCPAKCAGFSLLELLVSITVLVVISGGVLSVIGFYQKSFGRTEIRSDMYENVRGVAELMEQEIGQAGLVSLPTSTLTSAVAPSALAQTVNVSSTTSMYVGEQLLVDAGNSEELVAVSAIPSATTIKAIFAKTHAIVPPPPITALGVFASGIVPPLAADGSTANVLNIFGDINADGSLVYVRYTCTPGTSAAPGTLTRSVTTITPGVNAISAGQTLLSTLIGGAGLACFQYVSQASASGFTFVSNVGFTLSVQATRPDPQTLQYSTMTKSFLNLAPRNVLAGLEWATNNPGITPAGCPTNSSCRLQAAPANVSLY